MSTTFLATVLGWYLVIVSVLILFRYEHVKPVVTDILTQRSLIFILAIITVILGLLMVASHNIWMMGWPVVVTLLSWLVLMSGLIRLYCQDTAVKWGRYFLEHPMRMRIAGVINLIIGLYLLAHVYYPQYTMWNF